MKSIKAAVAAQTTNPQRFATDLERCMRSLADLIAAETRLADHCVAPADKAAAQAARMSSTLGDMRAAHGYAASLWCALYAAPLPEWPYMAEWREKLLCPWGARLRRCTLGTTSTFGDEIHGEAAPRNGEQAKYREQLLTMSCGLCHHLQEKLGPPPFTNGRAVSNTDAAGRPWVNQWDLCAAARPHAFAPATADCALCPCRYVTKVNGEGPNGSNDNCKFECAARPSAPQRRPPL